MKRNVEHSWCADDKRQHMIDDHALTLTCLFSIYLCIGAWPAWPNPINCDQFYQVTLLKQIENKSNQLISNWSDEQLR